MTPRGKVGGGDGAALPGLFGGAFETAVNQRQILRQLSRELQKRHRLVRAVARAAGADSRWRDTGDAHPSLERS